MFPKTNGLTNTEVQEKLKRFGPNVLPEKPLPSGLSVFLSQLRNPLVYVLLLAGIVTLAIQHYSDTLIILAAVVINTILGFIQERRAGNALYALKKLITPRAEVIRDGKRVKIEASFLVPEDLVILVPGAMVPADGEIVFDNRLYLDEAILTGESSPVPKKVKEKVFMGTIVSSGQALMRVEATGSLTKIGEIAEKVQEVKEETPLKKQLGRFSEKLVLLILGLVAFVFFAGILSGEKLADIFTTSVALAVSSIPEGLLVSLTVVLAIGMQKILKRRGLVRRLSSAETLGGVTTICLDKTGTLTQGKMRVVNFAGDKQELAKQAVLANDLDDPLVIAAFSWGREIIKNFIQKYQRIDSIPFSPKERFFASLHKWTNESNMLFVNGAPDFLLEWCYLTDKEKEEIKKTIEEFSSQGKRLIGFARKETSIENRSIETNEVKEGLTWVGLLVFSDPVRPGVKEALKQAKDAGINTIVITGDYPKTAEAVLAEIGISVSKDQIILGEDLEKMNLEDLSQKVKTVKLFARTSPDQKLKIVEALRKNGEVVAMMGDGVNDAPAIHEADIGIVVGEASDVARESADLVLLDSNFATVIAAIEEGRGMFENIRKIILYLMSDAFAEIIVILGSIVAGLPLAITAVQILWINLVSDGLPNLALTIDPVRKGIMRENPRPVKEPLVSKWMLFLIGITSLASGLIALASFFLVLTFTDNLILARSFAFAVLGLNSLTYVFSIRTLLVPFWKNNVFENKWLVMAVFMGIFLQVFPFLTFNLRQFFGIEKLSLNYWLAAGVLSIFVFMIIEALKIGYRVKHIRRFLR